MTKEELEKEAKEYAEQCYGWTNNDLALDVAKATYITSADPREKQITGLSKHILELQKDKGKLTDENNELKAQIEKMKNWCNCKNYQQCLIELAEQGKEMKPSECCLNCKKWEIKEKC